jgi:hypothetical protein
MDLTICKATVYILASKQMASDQLATQSTRPTRPNFAEVFMNSMLTNTHIHSTQFPSAQFPTAHLSSVQSAHDHLAAQSAHARCQELYAQAASYNAVRAVHGSWRHSVARVLYRWAVHLDGLYEQFDASWHESRKGLGKAQ